MLSNKNPIAANVLKALGITKPPLDVILKRVEGFSTAELKKQAEQIQPFLFEEGDADLIVNAHAVIPQLIERYQKASLLRVWKEGWLDRTKSLLRGDGSQ